MLCKLFQPGAKENDSKFKNSAFTRSKRKVFVLILTFFMFLEKNILKILIALNSNGIKDSKVIELAKKIAKKDGVSYICEKCGNEMFKFSVKDKNLFTADDSFIYGKYLNTADPNGPYLYLSVLWHNSQRLLYKWWVKY